MDIQAGLDLLVAHLPLELYAMVGSFLEEVIAPIPSALVMTTAAILALQQQYQWWEFVILAFFGSIGKTVANWLLYVAADKGEDYLVGKYGSYLGLSHQKIERLGKWFSRGWWDDVILFTLRALPIMPTALVSVVCGVLKTDMRSYLVTSFLGTLVRNGLYILIGIFGLEALMGIRDLLLS